MDTPDTVEVVVEKRELKHEVGKLMVGSIAAFIADRAASAAYDKVLHTVRARKVR